jgi:hypothetical protein
MPTLLRIEEDKPEEKRVKVLPFKQIDAVASNSMISRSIHY